MDNDYFFFDLEENNILDDEDDKEDDEDNEMNDQLEEESIIDEEIELYENLQDQLLESNSYLKMLAFNECYKCYSNINYGLSYSCIHTQYFIKHINSCDGKCELKDCLFYKAKLDEMNKCKCLNRNCSSCSSVKNNIFNRSHDDLTKISGITVN